MEPFQIAHSYWTKQAISTVSEAEETRACGGVFKLTRQKNGQWRYSVVHKFSGRDGNFPLADRS